MKPRDAKGRFTRKYRTATLGDKMLVWTMILGAIALVVTEEVNKFVQPVEAHTEQVEVIEPDPREVRIKVVVDWTPERIEEEIRKVFVETPNTAVAIAKAESQLNPSALNKEAHIGCSGSYGIFQIACVHESNSEELYDIEYNIKRAREIYLESGWSPWGAYTDGNWKKHL